MVHLKTVNAAVMLINRPHSRAQYSLSTTIRHKGTKVSYIAEALPARPPSFDDRSIGNQTFSK